MKGKQTIEKYRISMISQCTYGKKCNKIGEGKKHLSGNSDSQLVILFWKLP